MAFVIAIITGNAFYALPYDSFFKPVFAGFAFLSFAVGLAFFINWCWHMAAVRAREMSTAIVAGQINVWIAKRDHTNSFGALSDTKAQALVKLQPSMDVIPGNGNGPIWMLQLPGGPVEWPFVEQFISRCSDKDLAAVRLWNNDDFYKAQAITDYLVENGYARPASGNIPSTWIDKKAGLISIGYIRLEGEE